MASSLWQSGAAPSTWEPPSSFSVGYPAAGDLATGAHPTHVGAWWFQSMVDEIRNVIVAAGFIYDPTDPTQLLAAINSLYHPTYELREDGGLELREDASIEKRQ